MIGKAEWFQRRKYGGWGLHPKTWQGWVYIAIFALPLIAFHSIPIWSDKTRVVVTITWLAIILIDTADIMLHIKKDEREKRHEAIAERNAAYVLVGAVTLTILYDLIRGALQEEIVINPILAAGLIGAVIAKAITNYRLEKKN